MASQYDHIKRDALHSARAEIQILVQTYTRRLNETAISFIDSERAAGRGEVDGVGTELGRQAARVAAENWIGLGNAPTETLDAPAPSIETFTGS